VLLAGLDPISQVGMERALVDGGADVLAEVDPSAEALVQRAASCSPDAIVLGDGPSSSADLGPRLRVAAPEATIVIWGTDARMVAVLAAGADAPMLMPAPSAAELSRELFGHSGKGETCPST
jgi:DNA-binding NarL/FixJ family response regulator